MGMKIVAPDGTETEVPMEVESKGGAELEAWAKANVKGYPFPVATDPAAAPAPKAAAKAAATTKEG